MYIELRRTCRQPITQPGGSTLDAYALSALARRAPNETPGSRNTLANRRNQYPPSNPGIHTLHRRECRPKPLPVSEVHPELYRQGGESSTAWCIRSKQKLRASYMLATDRKCLRHVRPNRTGALRLSLVAHQFVRRVVTQKTRAQDMGRAYKIGVCSRSFAFRDRRKNSSAGRGIGDAIVENNCA